jgi:phospholipid-binding lipoprotein MlaA
MRESQPTFLRSMLRRTSPWLVAAALATGCASTSPQRQEIHDSLEPVNRPVFEINRQVDHHAFGPIARGYKKITPAVFRRSVSNAQRNLTFPQRFVSSVGQAEFEKAGVELGRFLVNSTVGVGGLFDPATKMGIAKYDEDLGKMLASWHVPPGPYIVIPVLGPSTARDGLGDLASIALNPLVWAGVSVPPIGVLFAINKRAENDDRIRAAEEASLDFYVFARDAYIQRRTRFIRNEYVTRLEEGEATEADYVLAPDLYDLPPDVAPPSPDCPQPPASDPPPPGDTPPPC